MNYKKPAFAFPGVSIPMCGSEPDFYHRHASIIHPFLEEGSKYSGTDFITKLLNPDSFSLDEQNEQLFFFSVSCGICSVYLNHGLKPHCMAGYSLGIYAALFVAGAISFQDGLSMIQEAYKLSSRSCSGQKCGMAIVIGLNNDELSEILDKNNYSSIRWANSNNHLATLFSGDIHTLQKLVTESQKKDAYKAGLLNVNLPFHNPDYLTDASVKFKRFLRTLNWNEPIYPIISSIDQRYLTDPEDLLHFTAYNISTPICWQDVIETLTIGEVDLVIECGPGISLTQNSRMILKSPRFVNIKNSQQRLKI